MSNFINLLENNAGVIGILVTLSATLGGIIVFIYNAIHGSKKMKADKKTLKQQMITNNIAPMRQAWINDLRKNISDFNMTAKIAIYELYKYFGSGQKSSDSELKIVEKKILKDYYKLNELAEYLNLLLPFSTEGENARKEEYADNLREAIKETIQGFDAIFDLLSNRSDDEASYIETANTINSSIEKVSDMAKKLLLQEWRVTKSLKELD